MTTKPALFSQVTLAEDLPKYRLRKGDFATVVEHYPMLNDEDGFSLEGFRDGLSLEPIEIEEITVEVHESQIQPIMSASKEDESRERLCLLSAKQLVNLAAYLSSIDTVLCSSDGNTDITAEALLIRVLHLPLTRLAEVEAFLNELLKTHLAIFVQPSSSSMGSQL